MKLGRDLRTKVPQEQQFFSCLNSDSSCLGEFHTSYYPSITGIATECVKTYVNRLGEGIRSVEGSQVFEVGGKRRFI